MAELVALLDFGSNAARFLLASIRPGAGFRILSEERVQTRLGGGRPGHLARAAVEDTLRAAHRFLARVRNGNGHEPRVIAVATSAVRDADNRDLLLHALERREGVSVRVLSGGEEARLGAQAALASRRVDEGAIADLGGGSLQLTRVRRRRAAAFASLPLGAVRLTRRFLQADPATPRELRALRRAIREGLLGALPAAQPGAALLGLGGTVRALARMHQARTRPRGRRPSRDGLCLLQSDITAARERIVAAEGVSLVRPKGATPEQQRFLEEYFRRMLLPAVTPLAIDPGHPFPQLAGRSLCLVASVRAKAVSALPHTALAVVHLPSHVWPRFVALPAPPGQHAFTLLEDVIRVHLPTLYHGYEVLSCHAIRVTRDSDIESDRGPSGDLLTSIESSLRDRRMGSTVRLQYDLDLPDDILATLVDELELGAEDLYPGTGFTAFSDLFQLYAAVDLPRLKDRPLPPHPVPQFEAGPDVWSAIRAGDVLVHHPYQSFDAVTRFVRDAAVDPKVLAIKMTLYRVSPSSPIAQALTLAAENGKEVAVLGPDPRGVHRRSLPRARARVLLDNDGEPEYLLASADWMPRNLDHRVEVAFPVLAPDLQRQIRAVLDAQLADTVKGRLIRPDGRSERLVPPSTGGLRSQERLYTLAAGSALAIQHS